nr:hypothetical protein [Tanacetum cinerariifolium]
KSPQDALTIIENKSKVHNYRSKLIASPVNACDNHSSSELAKLTRAVNQRTSAVTTAMTAMLKQFQSNPPPAEVKAVEEICVTCGGAHPYYQCLAALTRAVNQRTSAVTTAMTAMLKQFQSNPPPAEVKTVEEICVTCRGAHPYYQCLAASGNTFPEYRDNIQGYVSAATGNYNQGNPGYRPQGVANHGLVTEGPTVPNPPKSINPEEDECVEETYTNPDLMEYTIKVPPPLVQKPKPPIQRNFVLHTRD